MLSEQFVGARIAIEGHFCAPMSKLVRRHLYSDMSQDGLVNCVGNRRLAPSPAFIREEDCVRPLADHGRGNFVAVSVQSIRKRNWKFVIEFNPSLSFIAR